MDKNTPYDAPLRELEQGKQTLRIDKVNQVLALFGYEVGAVPAGKEHSV